MNTEEITSVTRNLTEALCLPAWRRLASNVNALFHRFAKHEAISHADGGVLKRCGHAADGDFDLAPLVTAALL
jgi:hypothetical protein